MSGFTPNFQLEYLAAGEPVRNTRAILERMARSIDAALTRGGVAAPAAQDLTAVAGRTTALEGRANALESRAAAVARQAYTGGPVTLAAGAAYTSPGGAQFALGGVAAGTWIEVGIAFACDNGAGDLRVDFCTWNATTGAAISYVSGLGAAGRGVRGMGAPGGRYEETAGSIPYRLTAADVSGGTVTLRPLFGGGAGGPRVLYADATQPATYWGRVIG